MQTETAQVPREKRFFSDQLMVELGQTLVERGRLSRAQLDDLQSRRALTDETLDKHLVKEHLVDEVEVLSALSDLSGIPFRHIAELRIDPEAVRKVQPRVALRYQVMPLSLSGASVTLAISGVPDQATADGLRMVLDGAPEWILCTEADITKSIKHFYGLGAGTIDDLIVGGEMPNQSAEAESMDVTEDSADAGVMKFVNQVIFEAISMRATDIHIEPFEDALRLRYRIDGILQEIPIPKAVVPLRRAIVSCVKILADMNIAERRKPHDGRIRVKSGTDEFDLRVSLLPTVYGETVNMRILNRKTMFIDLDNLGLKDAQLPAIRYLSSLPHGVVLLTGPTGSGKTTTLYAILSRINTKAVNIITVEDPVEYQIRGIKQIQVHAQIGLTFATILRHILRHDPNIILIGEIRDTETADIAIRASLTGHLVFSTLHTNDAPSAVTRLADMGVEPYLISSCLEGSIAQRLVRRVCAACRERMTPDDTILEEIAGTFPPERLREAAFYRGRGCPDCSFTGYRGRIALFEIMIMNDVLRSMVVRQRPSNELRNKAIENGLITLRHDGWSRAMEGGTSVDEVVRVTRRTEGPGAALV
jgi:type II secretory ATPase GspE/PulE/Tfp pilus assembly ATPase PilB-like protein